MVEVEQRALRPLEEHRPARAQRVVEQLRGVGDVGLEPVREPLEIREQLGAVERREVVDALQLLVLQRQRGVDLLAEDVAVEQVLHPDPDP